MNKAVVAALGEAGVFSFAHQRCMDGWFKATGRLLTALDVAAWDDYRQIQNMHRSRSLSSGFLVFALTQGHQPPAENIANVEHFVDEEVYIIS